jgi:hypothetical protein
VCEDFEPLLHLLRAKECKSDSHAVKMRCSEEPAYEAVRAYAPNLPELTTIFVTHSHWDHIGGQTYFRSLIPKPRFYSSPLAVVKDSKYCPMVSSILSPEAEARSAIWRSIPRSRFYLVIVIAVYVPFGTMSILCVFTMSLVAGSASCFVTTSPNSGSSCAALRRLSRSSLEG